LKKIDLDKEPYDLDFKYSSSQLDSFENKLDNISKIWAGTLNIGQVQFNQLDEKSKENWEAQVHESLSSKDYSSKPFLEDE